MSPRMEPRLWLVGPHLPSPARAGQSHMVRRSFCSPPPCGEGSGVGVIGWGLPDAQSGGADRMVGIRTNPMPSSFVQADLGNSAVVLECSRSARPII